MIQKGEQIPMTQITLNTTEDLTVLSHITLTKRLLEIDKYYKNNTLAASEVQLLTDYKTNILNEIKKRINIENNANN